MSQTTHLRRFSWLDRIFHLGLMVTFLIQAATGFSRMYIATPFGRAVSGVFGGYEGCQVVHHWVGFIMMGGFVVHLAYLLTRIRWRSLGRSVFGPDSLVPNLNDLRHLGQRVRWFFGLGPPPRLDRWAYWEKFDYWAVFWGLPLLAVTGLMMIYPMASSSLVPGWGLNVAGLLHRAEAILAVAYIFIVHFFIGHLRPSSFPMNEAMFSGRVPLGEAGEEKPAWVARLKAEGGLELARTRSPALWFRTVYFVFGYAALLCGVYLLVSGIVYSPYIRLH